MRVGYISSSFVVSMDDRVYDSPYKAKTTRKFGHLKNLDKTKLTLVALNRKLTVPHFLSTCRSRWYFCRNQFAFVDDLECFHLFHIRGHVW